MSVWFEIIATLFMVAYVFLLLMNYNATKNNFEALKKIHDLGSKLYQWLLVEMLGKFGNMFIEAFKKRFMTTEDEKE